MLIRPQRWVTLTVLIPLGFLVLAGIAAGLALMWSGQTVGLMFLAPAAFGGYTMRAFATARLWADDMEVGCTFVFQDGRCRRTEVAYLRIGPPRTRSGPSCNVVRHDGTAAFRTAVSLWGRPPLVRLAQFVGVPLVDG